MSDGPAHAERVTPGPGLGPALARVLAEVRAHAPEYRRWWLREHGAGSGSTPPWSDQDEERAAQLGSLDPWWMRSVADELERAHTALRDIGAELARMAHATIGGAAAARCALLAATSHERASEAATLASGARTEGDRVDALLDTVARRLTGVVDVPASPWESPTWKSPWESPSWKSPWESPSWKSPWESPSGESSGESQSGESPWREPPTRDLPWREPSWLRGPDGDEDGDKDGAEGYFAGYAAVLRAVRAELGSAIERLPTLVGLHPADRAQLGGWTAEPGPSAWTPEPGTGPQLPGTDARRVETDIGVRIARLPDGPRG